MAGACAQKHKTPCPPAARSCCSADAAGARLSRTQCPPPHSRPAASGARRSYHSELNIAFRTSNDAHCRRAVPLVVASIRHPCGACGVARNGQPGTPQFLPAETFLIRHMAELFTWRSCYRNILDTLFRSVFGRNNRVLPAKATSRWAATRTNREPLQPTQ